MISRLDFLFPSQVPVPSSPQYQKMIAEIGQGGRWTERLLLIVAALCLVPALLFVGRALWDWTRRGRVSLEVFVGVAFLVLGSLAFAISRWLEGPRRPYRLPAAQYANYKVVEARITELGRIVKQRPSYDGYRKVRWQSAPPLAREGWSPSFLVASKPLFGKPIATAEIRLNDVVYVGLDPSGQLPPLFLGLKRAAR